MPADAQADRPAGASRLERILERALWAGVAASLFLAVAGMFLLTLGFDEAWVLQGLHDVLGPVNPGLGISPVSSHGGLFALLELAVAAVAGPRVWAHRLVSFAALVVIVGVLLRAGRRQTTSSAASGLAVAALLGAPGTLVLGASALGGVFATALALLAVLAWDAAGDSRPRRWVLCGVLAGAAASSRLEWVMLFPALLAWAAFPGPSRRTRFLDAIATTLVGSFVFAVGAVWMAGLSEGSGAELSASAGFGKSLLDYPRVLNRFAIGDGLLPVAVMVLVTISAWAAVRDRAGAIPSWTALVPAGWLIWAVWAATAPIPHLRYLWPALACFAVAGGMALAHFHGRASELFRNAVLCIAIAWLASGCAVTLRALVLGDSDQLSFEWSREVRMPNYRRFQCVQDQSEAAEYVRSKFAANEELATIGGDLPLRFLAGRRVVSFATLIDENGRPRRELPDRFAICGGVGTYARMDSRGVRWIEDHCRLEAQFGQYCFYRRVAPYPDDVRILVPSVVDSPVQPLARGIEFNRR